MGGCVSRWSRGNGVSTENRALEHGDSSPSRSKERGSRRWKQSRSNRGSEKRGGSVSGRIYGMVDFGFLSRGGGGGGGGEEDLNRSHGRMFVNGASDVACLFTQQGRKGTNQDAMLVWENFGSRNDTIFCGVFDGHGPFGHMVAKKVRDTLPVKLFTHLKANGSDHGSLHENNSFLGSMNSEETGSISLDDEWCESLDLEENEKLPEMYLTLKQALLKAFKLMDKELKMHPTIDCFCSGTTAVTLVKQGQDLVIGNVGDSRAVLGTRDKDNFMIAVQLTVDLKPNLPREAARIQQCKGRVFALQDEPEVARVWLPNNDSPGLAMARAFGDFCLKDFGLISVPDISYRRLTERDEFIVLATDGVWDVLSNKEVVDIVASAPSRATAARAVVDTAVRAWRLKFPTSKSDDCAVVCLFLDPSSSYDQCQEGTLENKPAEAVDDMVSSSLDQGTNMTNGDPKGSEPDGVRELKGSEPDGVREPKGSEPDGVMVGGSSIECSDTITAEIVPISELKDEKEEKLPDRCQSTRSLAECIATAEEEEWSALEGVTRVNSLVNLPRFGSGDKKAANWRKWL